MFNGLCLYGWPSDIEYFQVIKSMSLQEFVNSCNTYPRSGSLADIIKGKFYIYRSYASPENYVLSTTNMSQTLDFSNQAVVFAQRGVDPYSLTYDTKVGLGRLFGWDNHDHIQDVVKLRLNIPIKNTVNPSGDEMMYIPSNNQNNDTTNNGLNLFYPSYVFQPAANALAMSGFPNNTGNLGSGYKPYVTQYPDYFSNLDSTTINLPSNNTTYNNTKDVFADSSNLYLFKRTRTDEMYDGKIFFLNINLWILFIV
jgi:hypothetical protein